MAENDPTANYRKYPTGPKFGLIVALSAVFLLIAAVAIVLFLKYNAIKVDPHNKTPTPNSRSVPYLPSSSFSTLQVQA